MIQMMLAAPASGSGKTAVTCGILALMKRKKQKTCAFKCGPDYIDPMFHRSVLGVESHNLDLFLTDESKIKRLYKRYSKGYDAVICEGVMGYYDGVGGVTDRASAWHLADTLGLPTIMVIDPKGASLTLAAQINGMCMMRKPHHIAGMILNKCSAMLYKTLAPMLERETGVPVLGYLPSIEEAKFESRHLGLYTAGEVEDIMERIEKIADVMEETLDFKKLKEVCGSGYAVTDNMENDSDAEAAYSSRIYKTGKIHIAVARDEAFCFIYHETLDTLIDAGAEPVFFSPVHDERLPEEAAGIYIPGGYPELYADKLAGNLSMRQSVYEAAGSGMPMIAECGGFLYLGKELQGYNGVMYPMTGVLSGKGIRKEKLVRFGYTNMTAKGDSLLFRAGEVIPAHEFHYWDSTENGSSIKAAKPISGRMWECCFVNDNLYAGFPHLYMAGRPEMAERFVQAAEKHHKSAVKKSCHNSGGISL